MKTGKRNRGRLGTLVFFIPLVVIVSVVVIGFIQLAQPGTLKVQAITVDRFLAPDKQNGSALVSVTVTAASGSGTNTGTTPTSFSLSSGTYTVSYGTDNWYKTPSSKTVSVPAGKTVYAVGVYEVLTAPVSITQSGFNATKIEALHGVTPVIWINNSGSSVVLSLETFGTFPLSAGQNYTKVFYDAGSFTFSVGGTASGTVQVS